MNISQTQNQNKAKQTSKKKKQQQQPQNLVKLPGAVCLALQLET